LSEKRDLWVPAVLALGGIGLLAWHLLRDDGNTVAGIVAALLGLGGAIACLPIRIRSGQLRVIAFGVGFALLLLALLPGRSHDVGHVAPFVIAALAFLVPIRTAPVQTRAVMLGAAGVFAVLSVLAVLEVVPAASLWLFVAGAFFLVAQVWNARPRPEKPPPPGPRICVFGGSFDPFHNGHRALAEAALRVNDRLLVVVAGSAPHKFLDEEGAAPDHTPFHHRVAMTRLGVEGLARTEVLELEGRRSGPSYTVDTLEVLVRSHPPGTRFRLLVGADMYQDFPNWRDWERIAEKATLLVARRPGFELEPPPELEGREVPVLGLEAPALDVSSTAIREAIAAGRPPPADTLAESIQGYIRDHGLYLPESEVEG
jgi:nicotinate-nucleotide adenylyltransferase